MRSTLLCALALATIGAEAIGLQPANVPATRRLRGDVPASLRLRGGGMSKSKAALTLNGLVSSVYGIGGTLSPNFVLAIYGAKEKLTFFTPAYGLAQFLGGVHIMVAARCFGALGVLPGVLPSRDPKEALGDMCIYHSVAAAIAAARTFEGAKVSWALASSSPLPGAIIMAAFSYSALKSIS